MTLLPFFKVLVLIILLLAGCVVPSSPMAKRGSDDVMSVVTTPKKGNITGQVLGLDGKPAVNVVVHASLISNHSASLVSHNSASYRVQADALEVITNQEGRFILANSSGQLLNIEAILSDEVKAIQLNVSSNARLQLAYTGSLTGRVTAPNVPSVNDFMGVDVFIPGTSYLAKTDRAGRYILSNVPAGAFNLMASKESLGTANLSDVRILSKTITTAPNLELSLMPPTLKSVFPENGGPGSTLTLSGEHFGSSSGDLFQVTVGGLLVNNPVRVDDRTIRITVPSGATSGDLIVKVKGVQSNALPFQVLKAMSFTADHWDLNLLKGATRSFSVSATDSAGQGIATPVVTWSLTGSAASLDASGAVRGVSSGYVTLKATSGTLTTTLPLRVFDRFPEVKTLAGSGKAGFHDGAGAQAQFIEPNGIAVSATGTVYVSEGSLPANNWHNNRIRQIAADGTVTTLAGNGEPGFVDGRLSTAQFAAPKGLHLASNGDLYVAEFHYARIRKISGGTVSTFVSLRVAPQGITLDANHNLYMALFCNNFIGKVTQASSASFIAGSGYSGYQDGPADAAQLHGPTGVAIDPAGNLYFTEFNNHCVRKLSAAGIVSTIAGNGSPGYVDGEGGRAMFNYPTDIAIDARGHLFVADSGNSLVREISPEGIVTTIAGTGVHGYQDGSGTVAQFVAPQCLAVDPTGSVYVTDRGNNCIRKITF